MHNNNNNRHQQNWTTPASDPRQNRHRPGNFQQQRQNRNNSNSRQTDNQFPHFLPASTMQWVNRIQARMERSTSPVLIRSTPRPRPPPQPVLLPPPQPQQIPVKYELFEDTKGELTKKDYKKFGRKCNRRGLAAFLAGQEAGNIDEMGQKEADIAGTSSEKKLKKHKKEKKKKKRRRHRSASSSSSSADSLDSEEEEAADQPGTSSSHRHRDKSKKKKKKRRRLRSTSSSSSSVDSDICGGEEYLAALLQNDRRKAENSFTLKWSNLNVISEHFPELAIDIQRAKPKERLYAEKYTVDWGKNVERKFRDAKNNFGGNSVQISHQPMPENAKDGGPSAMEIDADASRIKHRLKLSDIDARERKKTNRSWKECLALDNVSERHSVLHKRTKDNSRDVEAWLEYMDIRFRNLRPHQAFFEYGDPNAPIQNESQYFGNILEIARRATTANPRSPELEIKKLQILHTRHDYEQDKKETEWKELEDASLHHPAMWEGRLKMLINDGDKFNLQTILKKIDECMQTLVEIKFRINDKWTYLQGTDEFLVKLLLTRCQLLISAGFLDKAIGMLQALAEFHFFRPEHLDEAKMNIAAKWDKAKAEFAAFWASGTYRIGDKNTAMGWQNYDADSWDVQESIDEEFDELQEISMEFRQNIEPVCLREYREEGGSSRIEAQRRIEQLRMKHFWKPVRHSHADMGPVEYKSRFVTFEDDLKNVLFPFENMALTRLLMFNLLNQFGIQIPGLFEENAKNGIGIQQQDILQQLSGEMFPSTRPNAFELSGFSQFIENFIQKLAESKAIDSARIYAGLATSISNYSMNIDEKITQLSDLTDRCYNDELLANWNLDKKTKLECKLSVFVHIFEELIKFGRPDTIENAYKILYSHLDLNNLEFWQIRNQRKHLLFLRLIAIVVRLLPFSDEPEAEAYEKFGNNPIELGEQSEYLKTKREFLYAFWTTGKMAQLPINSAGKKILEKNMKDILENPPSQKLSATSKAEDLWICNEWVLLFEMAALCCYEFKFKWSVFTTELAKWLTKQGGQENLVQLHQIRVQILEHIIHVSNGAQYTPGDLVKMIGEDLLPKCPFNLPLLKIFMDKSSGFEQRMFLSKIADGNDKFTRRIYAIASLYACVGQKNFADKFRNVAQKYSDNLIPDDYIWLQLIRIANQKNLPTKAIDELVEVAEQFCSWSKQLLFEAARMRPNSDGQFLAKLNTQPMVRGLNKYTAEGEINDSMSQ